MPLKNHFSACNKPLIRNPTNPISIIETYLWPWCYTLTRYMYMLMVCAFKIWMMSATYLDECYISRRWRLHIWTGVTYLDDGGYISGRVLHIWTMEVTYLDGCYISEKLHIYARHTCVPLYAHGTHEVKLFVEILTTSKVLTYGHCEHRYINVEIFSCVSI